MKIYIMCIFVTFIPNVEFHLLPIQNKKICANCKFFISNTKECSKYGDVDIITGKYDYEDATSVRKDESKCGEDAIFFKNNNFKFLSIPSKLLLKIIDFFPFIFLAFLWDKIF